MKLLPPCRAILKLFLPRRAAWRLGAPVDLTAGGWSRWLRRSGFWRLSCTPPGLPSRGNTTSGGPIFPPSIRLCFAPDWWPLSPALLILWVPAGFRLTCYYYRKAYYRSLFATPAACSVRCRPQHYRGEQGLLRFQNLHRYFLYLALVLVVILWIDAIRSYIFPTGFGIGVGSIVLTLNAYLLMGFTFGCNSLRHLVGGNVNCFSREPFGKQRYKLWQWVTRFNEHHMAMGLGKPVLGRVQ